VILALPLNPEAKLTGNELFGVGSGKILWASPTMATALGGSGLGATAAKFYLGSARKSGVLTQVGEVFDIADGPLGDALTKCVEDRQISGAEGKLFKLPSRALKFFANARILRKIRVGWKEGYRFF
jgi:hypothetical protein